MLEIGKLSDVILNQSRLDCLSHLTTKSMNHAWSVSAWKEAYESDKENKNYTLAVMSESSGETSFFFAMALWLEQQDCAHLLKICVAPERRREGLGFSLLTKTMDHLKEQGHKRFFLEVEENNYGAIKLYESFGFQQVCLKKRFYSDGAHALAMLKE